MDQLPIDLFLYVADFVGIVECVSMMTVLSKSHHDIVSPDNSVLYESLVTQRFQSLPNLLASPLYRTHQPANNHHYWHDLFRELVSFQSTLTEGETFVSFVSFDDPSWKNSEKKRFRSTVDNSAQDISQTQKPDMEFWSSEGSNEPDSDEFLIYKMKDAHTLITSVDISFYQALYQVGRPCYAPLKVRISVGNELDSMDFVSEQLKVRNVPTPQRIKLVPNFCFGRFIKVELIGKRQKQPDDLKYYTCVRWLTARGIDCSYGASSQHVRPLPSSLRGKLLNFANPSELEDTSTDVIVPTFDDHRMNDVILKSRTDGSDNFPDAHFAGLIDRWMTMVHPEDDEWLTPLESVLVLDSFHESIKTGRFPGIDKGLFYFLNSLVIACEEVGDWYLSQRDFPAARRVYIEANCRNDILTTYIRSIFEDGKRNQNDMRQHLSHIISEYSLPEADHIMSMALSYYKFYDQDAKIHTATSIQVSSILCLITVAQELGLTNCLAEPIPEHSGITYVDFEKPPKKYEDYLFIQ